MRNIRKDDNLSYVSLCPRYSISHQYFSVIPYSVHIFWSISRAQTTAIFLFLTIQSRLKMESYVQYKNRIKIWAEAVRCSPSIMKWKWGPINAKVTANEIGGIIMMVRIIQVFFPVQMIQTLTDPLFHLSNRMIPIPD